MVFDIGLTGFRVFETTQEVQIRPITLLTGGNSTGKTTFLAASRLLSELSNFSSAPASFNKDPFFLGSFDQIAHHRGGRYGRDKTFSLRVRGKPVLRDEISIRGSGPIRLPDTACITFSYANRLGQPAISGFSYEADDVEVSATFAKDWRSASLFIDFEGKRVRRDIDADDQPSIDFTLAQSQYFSVWLDRTVYTTLFSREDPKSASVAHRLSQHIEAALSMVPPMGFAGGPVRTRPLRTYDPIDSAPISEGSHVPSRMAQLSRTNLAEWNATKSELVEFGRASGLFKDLEVRRLGKGDSDPFQINVSINGPKRNLVDVGYGVSQAIPIVFELATRSEDQIYMFQQPEVHLHPQAQAALGTYIVNNIRSNPGYIILETHSDYIIDRIRRHVRDGDVAASDVSLLYFQRFEFNSKIWQLEIGENGELTKVPSGYRSFFVREQIENLDL